VPSRAGSVHSLALKSDGRVAVWGSNEYGQLGDGTTSDRHAPIVLNTVGNVKAIAAGGSHSLAMVSDPVLAQ
jgi:alpha-tubulin suppressor-like RCC1 family protein